VKVATKTGKLLTKAGDRVPLAEAALDLGKIKKAKRQVAKARGAIRRFAKRLGGKKGPKIVVDDAVRSALASDASALEARPAHPARFAAMSGRAGSARPAPLVLDSGRPAQ
jgi:hypothetical protein